MKALYKKTENLFEKFSIRATSLLGNSITFIIALILVAFYFTDKRVYKQPGNKTIMDVIFAVTFLSIFIIQKSVNRFSAAVHLKINELVSAHENADNKLINIEEKTEEELKELAKQYASVPVQDSSSEEIKTSNLPEEKI